MKLRKRMSRKHASLRNVLLRHADNVKSEYHAPWLDQKPLTMKNANKFFLGAIIDYQIGADMAWDNAKRLSEKVLGDPASLWVHITNSYTKEDWAAKWRQFRVHRFPAAHNRIWRIGYAIVKGYDGDVRNIWQGENAEAVLKKLEGMRCGQEISRMIVGMLITYKQIDGTGDVKADRHVCRVLGRVFAQSFDPTAARQVARKICPGNPWGIDIALYDIGKWYCLSDWCYCEYCPIGKHNDLCEDYRKYNANRMDNNH